MGKFFSTKTYNTDKGLSCCFRQWKATHSHCSKIHGYSIGVKLTFSCDTLDERNWVMDFGGLKPVKAWLEYMFDHTYLCAKDDPALEYIEGLHNAGILNLRTVDAVGCEKFAEMVFLFVKNHLETNREVLLNKTVKIHSAEVFEHSANSSIYQED